MSSGGFRPAMRRISNAIPGMTCIRWLRSDVSGRRARFGQKCVARIASALLMAELNSSHVDIETGDGGRGLLRSRRQGYAGRDPSIPRRTNFSLYPASRLFAAPLGLQNLIGAPANGAGPVHESEYVPVLNADIVRLAS